MTDANENCYVFSPFFANFVAREKNPNKHNSSIQLEKNIISNLKHILPCLFLSLFSKSQTLIEGTGKTCPFLIYMYFLQKKNCNSIGPLTFCLAPLLKKKKSMFTCLNYKENNFLFLMMPLDHAKYSSYKLPHFLQLVIFFSFSFQYLVNLTTVILSIGLLGIIVLFRKSRRALPDHKP